MRLLLPVLLLLAGAAAAGGQAGSSHRPRAATAASAVGGGQAPAGSGAALRSLLQQLPGGKLGGVLPLHVRHGVQRGQGGRRRQLLRATRRGAALPVLGAVRDGYFYAQLSLGTPPRSFSVIIDTGSTITYIPCATCQHCGTHMDAAFDPARSSTATLLPCSHALCQCGSPACGCRQQTCYYTRHYAEMSSSEGWMVADRLHLLDAAAGSTSTSSASAGGAAAAALDLEVVFGCENVETGEIYRQAVDGVLGMGNNANALPRQLARSGLVDDVFALCYGFPSGGALLLGDVPLPPRLSLTYTPLLPSGQHYYTIQTLGISLGGQALRVPASAYASGYGSVLDSGTTFTYLPSPAFRAFVAAVEAALAASPRGRQLKRVPGSDPQYDDVCWRDAPADWAELDGVFPRGNISFAGGASITLTPPRYLFSPGRGQYCLGLFDNGDQGTLLGGIVARNVLVQYDRERNRVGIGDADCGSLQAGVAAAAAEEAASDASPAGSAAATQQAGKAASTEPASGSADSSAATAAGDAVPEPDSAGDDGSRPHIRQTASQDLAGGPAQQQDAAPGLEQARTPPAARVSAAVWLGLGVGSVLVAALAQLAWHTLWRPRSPKAGGGGGGGAAHRAAGSGAGYRRAAQSAAAADCEDAGSGGEQQEQGMELLPMLPSSRGANA